MIADKKFDALVDSNFEISNENELRDHLIKAAIEDSKKKAELACSVTEQKIIGIKRIDLGDTEDFYYHGAVIKCLAPADDRLSDHLQSPTTTLDESVTVIWEIL